MSKNPFADLFSSFAGNSSFADACNLDKLVAIGRLNAKAFTEATNVATSGFQAVYSRQAKSAQETAEECLRFFKEANSSSAKSPEAGIARNAEFANASFKSATSNLNEICEIAAKSAREASKIIGERVTSSISELASANSNNVAAKKNKNEAA